MRSASWTSLTGSSLHRVVQALETLPEPEWAAASLCEGWSRRDVAAHLVWRLDPDVTRMLGRGVGALLARGPRLIDGLAALDASRSTAQIVAALRAAASAFMGGEARDSRFDMAEAVVHGLDLDLGIRFSRTATYESAIARGPAVPRTVREELRRHTLVAEDAGWRIGSGPALATTADDIVRFVYGRQPSPAPRSAGIR